MSLCEWHRLLSDVLDSILKLGHISEPFCLRGHDNTFYCDDSFACAFKRSSRSSTILQQHQHLHQSPLSYGGVSSGFPTRCVIMCDIVAYNSLWLLSNLSPLRFRLMHKYRTQHGLLQATPFASPPLCVWCVNPSLDGVLGSFSRGRRGSSTRFP